jgi:hypothetical protein
MLVNEPRGKSRMVIRVQPGVNAGPIAACSGKDRERSWEPTFLEERERKRGKTSYLGDIQPTPRPFAAESSAYFSTDPWIGALSCGTGLFSIPLPRHRPNRRNFRPQLWHRTQTISREKGNTNRALALLLFFTSVDLHVGQFMVLRSLGPPRSAPLRPHAVLPKLDQSYWGFDSRSWSSSCGPQ